MPLEQILAAIEAEAKAEVERIEAETRSEMGRIEAEAAERAVAIQAERAGRRDSEVRLITSAIVNRARLTADRRLADAREEAFAEALARLDDRLAGIRSSPGYESLLGRLVTEALGALPPARLIHCDPADADLVALVAEGVEIDPSISTWGGVIADAGDGRLADDRLETRRWKAEPYLRLLAGRYLPVEAS